MSAPQMAELWRTSDGELIAEFAYAVGEVTDRRHTHGTAVYEEIVNDARILRDELTRRLEQAAALVQLVRARRRLADAKWGTAGPLGRAAACREAEVEVDAAWAAAEAICPPTATVEATA